MLGVTLSDNSFGWMTLGEFFVRLTTWCRPRVRWEWGSKWLTGKVQLLFQVLASCLENHLRIGKKDVRTTLPSSAHPDPLFTFIWFYWPADCNVDWNCCSPLALSDLWQGKSWEGKITPGLGGRQRSPEEGVQPTPVLLPGESHGQGRLAGYSPRGRTESDTTEQLSMRAHDDTVSFPRWVCVCKGVTALLGCGHQWFCLSSHARYINYLSLHIEWSPRFSSLKVILFFWIRSSLAGALGSVLVTRLQSWCRPELRLPEGLLRLENQTRRVGKVNSDPIQFPPFIMRNYCSSQAQPETVLRQVTCVNPWSQWGSLECLLVT